MDESLKENYAGAFDGRLAPGRNVALIIVDLVVAYLDPDSPLYAAGESALASNERLVAAARAKGVPVVFTYVTYDEEGRNGGLFFRKVPSLKCFVPGSPYAAFPPSLQPQPHDILVPKQYPSAFFATSLAPTLHALGVDTAIITGFSTSGCVRASALDALCHGFIPVVARDACADRHAAPHEANLFDLQAKYAEVVDEAMALSIIAGNQA